MAAPDPNSIHAQATEVNILHLLFIGVKCIIIIIMMLFGIRAHYMRSQKITRVTKIFTFYIGVMGALLVMETVYHDLMLFYLVLVASTVGLIWLIEMFVDRVKRYVSYDHYKASKWAVRICYGITISLVVFGLLPKIGARCHSFMVYPMCFFLYLFFHILLYLLTSFFWCKKYFVQQDLVLAEEETYQLPERNSANSSNNAAELPISTAKQYSFRKMFSTQINRFQLMHTVHAIINIMLIVYAYRLNTLKEYDFLQCYSDADHVWKVNRYFGQTF
jgi:hypothetical protein